MGIEQGKMGKILGSSLEGIVNSKTLKHVQAYCMESYNLLCGCQFGMHSIVSPLLKLGCS